MEIAEIIPHIEALIFASEKPLTSMELTELINNAFGFMEEKLTLEQIQTALDGIIEKYSAVFYPFEVRESGGGWQFLTKREYHKTVGQLNGEKFLKRLSSAALETLAIIAYKQPITKGEIESIRGVSSDYSIQKLLEKELIVIAGRNEEMPGKPLVYTTSKTFMDYFGINSAEDLPKLKEVFAETMVEPTVISHIPGEIHQTEEAASVTLIVSGEGELVENEDEQEVPDARDHQAGETEAGEEHEAGHEEEMETGTEPAHDHSGYDHPGQQDQEDGSHQEDQQDPEEDKK